MFRFSKHSKIYMTKIRGWERGGILALKQILRVIVHPLLL
ncbi:hypothetical protein Gotur_027521 [Gossypium turneri]